MASPEVSVIIPTWNRAATLGRAINSALSQTLQPVEVLICDDGSTDDSEKIVREISERDCRVRWISGKRGGRPAIPRNRGINESRGEWLAFLDSDDEWLPKKLELQLDALLFSGAKASSTNALRLLPAEGLKGRLLDFESSTLSFEDLLKVNLVICSSAIIHRNLIRRVKGFPEDPKLKALEDYALWLRVASLTPVIYVREPLVIYLDDASNSVRKDDVDTRLQKTRVLTNFIAWGGRPGNGVGLRHLLLSIGYLLSSKQS